MSCITNNLKYSVLQINVNISKIIANSINTRTVNHKRLKDTKAFIHLHWKHNYTWNERLMLKKIQIALLNRFTLPIRRVRNAHLSMYHYPQVAVVQFFLVCNTKSQPRHTDNMKRTLIKTKRLPSTHLFVHCFGMNM